MSEVTERETSICPYCTHQVVVRADRFVEHCPSATSRTPIWAMPLACPGSGEPPPAR